MLNPSFTLSSVVFRLLLCCTLVFGTYNPSGRSYLHWVVNGDSDTLILKFLVGLTLIAAYWLVLIISWLALGIIGFILTVLVVLAFGGALWEFGLFPVETWTVQVALLGGLSTCFAIGLSFSGVRHRLSRQVQSSAVTRTPLF